MAHVACTLYLRDPCVGTKVKEIWKYIFILKTLLKNSSVGILVGYRSYYGYVG